MPTKRIYCVECQKNMIVEDFESNYQVCDTCEQELYANTNREDSVCYICHEHVPQFMGHQIEQNPCYCSNCY